MPKWLRMVLIAVGAMLIVLVAAGFFGAMALKRTFEDVEKASQEAKVDGEAFGMNGTPDGCLEEAVRRSGNCMGINMTCLPPVGAFLWACVEEAPHDPAFCSGLPSAGNEHATLEWGRSACRKYGQPDNDLCAVTVSTIIGFCEMNSR